MSEQLDLKLSELASGGVQEKFNRELKRVAENILDPNTDPKKKRKITLTTTFMPNDERNVVTVSVAAKSTLVPDNEVSATVLMGRNTDSGYLEANELKSGVPGQTYFDAEDSTLKDDKGKPITEVEQKENNVVDLQSKHN